MRFYFDLLCVFVIHFLSGSVQAQQAHGCCALQDATMTVRNIAQFKR